MPKTATPEVVAPLRAQKLSYPAIAAKLAKSGYRNMSGNALTAQNVRRLCSANKVETAARKAVATELAKPDPKPAKRMTGRLTWEDVPAELRADVVREIADRLCAGGVK